MRLTTAEFLKTKVDLTRPGLGEIPAKLDRGDLCGAEADFAAYLRATLRPDDYFQIPYYAPENVWLKKGETEQDVAERLAHGEVMSCGFMHNFGEGGIRFEANPTPNQYREWTWQLNRHHEWRMLGHLYRETGDEAYARLFVSLFSQWRAQCECPDDVSGHETKAFRTIEIGIRLTKIWHYAIHAFIFSPSLSDHVLCEIFASLWENANRLRLHPTHGNWLIMEMAGLFHCGVLYPFLPDAADWKKYAADRLTAELDVQIYPDSFQYELSTGYHGVVLSNYSYAVDLCRAMGEALPDRFLALLHLTFDLYPKLCQPNMRLPDLNDGGRPDAAAVSRRGIGYFPDKEELVYFATERREGRPIFPKDTVMMYSGMAVLRDSWEADSEWLYFESAPFGRGHQHEDKLQLLLYAYGRDLLCDTGNYAYDTSEMRRYVLSTRAHNTAMVDGLEQNRRGRYVWHDEDIGKRSDLAVQLGEDADILDGVYDEGYGKEYLPVVHRRRVIKVKNHPLGMKTFYIVLDRFTSPGKESHRYDVQWLLEDVPLVTKSCGTATRIDADYGDGVTFTLIADGALTLRRGSASPFMGWRTPDRPAPSLVFSKSGASAEIVTVLYPTDSHCPITALRKDETAITLETPTGSWTWETGVE